MKGKLKRLGIIYVKEINLNEILWMIINNYQKVEIIVKFKIILQCLRKNVDKDINL